MGVDKMALYMQHWPGFLVNAYSNDAYLDGFVKVGTSTGGASPGASPGGGVRAFPGAFPGGRLCRHGLPPPTPTPPHTIDQGAGTGRRHWRLQLQRPEAPRRLPEAAAGGDPPRLQPGVMGVVAHTKGEVGNIDWLAI